MPFCVTPLRVNVKVLPPLAVKVPAAAVPSGWVRVIVDEERFKPEIVSEAVTTTWVKGVVRTAELDGVTELIVGEDVSIVLSDKNVTVDEEVSVRLSDWSAALMALGPAVLQHRVAAAMDPELSVKFVVLTSRSPGRFGKKLTDTNLLGTGLLYISINVTLIETVLPSTAIGVDMLIVELSGFTGFGVKLTEALDTIVMLSVISVAVIVFFSALVAQNEANAWPLEFVLSVGWIINELLPDTEMVTSLLATALPSRSFSVTVTLTGTRDEPTTLSETLANRFEPRALTLLVIHQL